MKKFAFLLLTGLLAMFAIGCSTAVDEAESFGEQEQALLCHGDKPDGAIGTASGSYDGDICAIHSGHGYMGYDASDWLVSFCDPSGNPLYTDVIDFGTTAEAEFFGQWSSAGTPATTFTFKTGVTAGSHPNADSCDYGTNYHCIVINGVTSLLVKNTKVSFTTTGTLSLGSGLTAIVGSNTAGGGSGADRLRFYRNNGGTVSQTTSGWVMQYATCP